MRVDLLYLRECGCINAVFDNGEIFDWNRRGDIGKEYSWREDPDALPRRSAK